MSIYAKNLISKYNRQQCTECTKNVRLASLKSDFDVLDIDKSKTVSVNLGNISSVVKK